MTSRIHTLLRAAFILLCFVKVFTANAQDTVKLIEIDVISKKTQLSFTGKKTELLDSAAKQRFVYSSLGDILSLNSPVFIKNYGPGSLSTTSFRGGNASQTGIIWNGFNIQNMMLGQIDLASMPSVLFDNIRVEFGGSSALWGSGAVGGSIHLDNKPVFNRGLTTKVNLGMGSYDLFNASTHVEYSRQKFISTTKAYLQSAINNFLYKDTLDKVQPYKRQSHGSYTFSGVLQDFKFMITPKQIISANIWYNAGVREIPVYNILSVSRAIQKDRNIKSSVNWNYLTNSFSSNIRTALFHDELNYGDSALSVYSESRLNTFIAENENIFRWADNNEFNAGLNITSAQGTSSGYSGEKVLNKAAVCAGNKFSFAENKFLIYLALRGEMISSGEIPVTGNASFEYFPVKNLSLKLNAAKVYRQPTLNERYWTPGGNPQLKAEEGYTFEGDASFTKYFTSFRILVSGSAFNRRIDNWILWLPGPLATTPVNIQEVWSRGTETNTKITYIKNKFSISLGTITSYVLSTVSSDRQENGNTENKQLIYTPRYTVNSNLSIVFNRYSLSYYHQYVGYRFTASDNLQWLPPYHYSTLRFNLSSSIKETAFILFAACNNIFDTNYSIVAGRNMPLRNFEAGISLHANRPVKPKQNNLSDN